jgi:hypothetical protein
LPDLQGWDRALHDLERRVASCLAGHPDLLVDWGPVPDLGPLPPELAARAAALALAQGEALASLESERIRVLDEISATPAPSRPVRPAIGVYFDATA